MVAKPRAAVPLSSLVRSAVKQPTGLRGVLLFTHRWLGLASSWVLSIVGASGAVIVWQREDLLQRIAGRFHEQLAIGPIGRWIVVVATAGAVVLQLSGLILWWRRKAMRVRWRLEWKRVLIDLHHPVGAVFLPLMLILAVSGTGMAFITPGAHPELRRVLVTFHTAGYFPLGIKVLYTAGTMAFVIQGVTGVVMWWRNREARRSR